MSASHTILLHTNQPDPAAAIIGEDHPDLKIAVHDRYDGLEEAVAACGAEIVYSIRFAGTPGFPRAALVENPRVRWVSIGGSGSDHLSPWDPARVTVTNAAGVAADMMAEFALGAILHFSLNIDHFRQAQESRDWIAGKVSPIGGKTVLIVGLGRTGQAAARRFKAMGLEVLGVRARPDPTPDVDEVFHFDMLATIAARADFVVVCAPLLPSSRGLIGAAAFASMKKGTVFVDLSRGGIVDETALMAALDSHTLKGAALDVFATEPLPLEHPLWRYDNVLITPHCSSVFEGWEQKSVKMFSENLNRYRRGKPLLNIVDPVRGY